METFAASDSELVDAVLARLGAEFPGLDSPTGTIETGTALLSSPFTTPAGQTWHLEVQPAANGLRFTRRRPDVHLVRRMPVGGHSPVTLSVINDVFAGRALTDLLRRARAEAAQCGADPSVFTAAALEDALGLRS